MKTGFKGPLQPKQTQRKEAPWDFRMPEYDERTSCYVNAGSHYGIGQRQPVGHMTGAKNVVEALPQKDQEMVFVARRTNLPTDVQQ